MSLLDWQANISRTIFTSSLVKKWYSGDLAKLCQYRNRYKQLFFKVSFVNIAVIGGGAAGFFAAINIRDNFPTAKVTIYEKTSNLLAKVKISGGGRCNVTNACDTLAELCSAYPRGANALKKAFRTFDNHAAMTWFETHQVPMVTQADNCVFPQAQDSKVIIDCFLREARRLNIDIVTECGVKSLSKMEHGKLKLCFNGDKLPPKAFDKVVVTTGGTPRQSDFTWLEQLGHTIEVPVPSLFTFKINDPVLTAMMGIVVENTQVTLQGTKFKSEGPLLVTHWGVSGPAVLKLSALAARWLHEQNYHCTLQVNWVNERNQDVIASQLETIIQNSSKKMLSNVKPFHLTDRLWHYLLDKCQLPADKRWGELGKNAINKLVNILCHDCYQISGKGSFKEEFVTCGGVSLKDIDMTTMQSKKVDNLYFAGEVLDIDGITGGYNFQAAWTTAFIAAKLSGQEP